ncbi:Uncharacterised protein [Bordetella pertussis]|nr:Uncharacterised protein [Bordetella pertussis]CFP69044.1 Uncharacterised protein [Bordetella pertussis]
MASGTLRWPASAMLSASGSQGRAAVKGSPPRRRATSA